MQVWLSRPWLLAGLALLLLPPAGFPVPFGGLEKPDAGVESALTDPNDFLAIRLGWFTANRGQAGDDAIVFTYSRGGAAFLESAVLMELWSGESRSIVTITFPGANPVTPAGAGMLSHRSNYFLGNDPGAWRTDVPNYERVIYRGLYDGIDLVYYASAEGLKYDWVVHPDAAPEAIRQRYEGAVLGLEHGGGLVVAADGGEWREAPPFGEQEGTEIPIQFRLVSEDTLSYEVGRFDKTQALIIDPLIFSTFIGGSGIDGSGYYGNLAVDGEGYIYVGGDTESNNFPTTEGAYQEDRAGNRDICVFKLSPDGSELVYSTYIGGSKYDSARDLALDSNGSAYLTGVVEGGGDFPTTSGAYDRSYNGDYDVFVLKLSSDGSELEYSTYIGGNAYDDGQAITLDSDNNAYITGYTESSNFPTTSGAYDTSHNGNSDIFVSKLSSDGSDLEYSTFIGTDRKERGRSIVLDEERNAYVSGDTLSPSFPTTDGAYDTTHNGNQDIIVFKLTSDGSDLDYSTFVGNSDNEWGMDVALDSGGNATVTGFTDSSGFPTTDGAYDTTYNGGRDGYVFQLNADGSDLIYSTFLGGSETDYAYAVSLGNNDNAFVIGATSSSDFPVTNGSYDTSYNGNGDAFVLQLSNDGTELINSTFIGGNESDSANEVFVDNNHLFLVGSTYSTDFPVTDNANDTSHNGDRDFFVLELSFASRLNASIDSISPSAPNEGDEVTFSGSGSDSDGSVAGYQWRSSIDGDLSTEDIFSTSGLSPGDHTIYLKVQDNDGAWSPEVSRVLKVNRYPTASIDSISPSAPNEGDEVTFSGFGSDSDGSVAGYQWRSSIDDNLSTAGNFSTASLSPGYHTITLQVQDNDGAWSTVVSQGLYINALPTASIDSLPSAPEADRSLGFQGSGSDSDGEIVAYEWDFDSDGAADYSGSASAANHVYADPGTYTVWFRVQDNNSAWSEWTTATLEVAPAASESDVGPDEIDIGGIFIISTREAAGGVALLFVLLVVGVAVYRRRAVPPEVRAERLRLEQQRAAAAVARSAAAARHREAQRRRLEAQQRLEIQRQEEQRLQLDEQRRLAAARQTEAAALQQALAGMYPSGGWSLPGGLREGEPVLAEFFGLRCQAYRAWPRNEPQLDYLHNQRVRFAIFSYFEIPTSPAEVLQGWALPPGLRGNVHLDAARAGVVETLLAAEPDRNFVIIGEPGVGKTAVLFEALDRVMARGPAGLLTTPAIGAAHAFFGIRLFYDDIPENAALVDAIAAREVGGLVVTAREADWQALPRKFQARFDRLTVPLFSEAEMRPLCEKILTFSGVSYDAPAVAAVISYAEGSPIYVWSLVRELLNKGQRRLSQQYIRENATRGMTNYVSLLLQQLLKDGEQFQPGGLHALTSLVFLADYMEERTAQSAYFHTVASLLSKSVRKALDDEMNQGVFLRILRYLSGEGEMVRFPHDTWVDVLRGGGALNPFRAELQVIQREFIDSRLFARAKYEAVAETWETLVNRYSDNPTRQKDAFLALADTLLRNFNISELKKLGVDTSYIREVAVRYSHLSVAATLISKLQAAEPTKVTNIINIQDSVISRSSIGGGGGGSASVSGSVVGRSGRRVKRPR